MRNRGDESIVLAVAFPTDTHDEIECSDEQQMSAPAPPSTRAPWSTSGTLRRGRGLTQAPAGWSLSLSLASSTFAGTSEAKIPDGRWAAKTAMTIIAATQMGAGLLQDSGEFEAGVRDSLES